MITLSGFRVGEDIDIVFTGVRPGEKLFEELRTAGEDIEPTVHPKVLVWKHEPVQWDRVQECYRRLEQLQNCLDRRSIIDAFRDLVPEYEPLNPPKDDSQTDLRSSTVKSNWPVSASGRKAAREREPHSPVIS